MNGHDYPELFDPTEDERPGDGGDDYAEYMAALGQDDDLLRCAQCDGAGAIEVIHRGGQVQIVALEDCPVCGGRGWIVR